MTLKHTTTKLHVYLVRVGLQCQKADNPKVIMKSPIHFAWRYMYLIKVQKYRENCCLIIYLDKTWFVHLILFVCFGLMVQIFGLMVQIFVSGPSPRGKGKVIYHAGSSKGFVENSPFTL